MPVTSEREITSMSRFKEPHDGVWVKIRNDRYHGYFPSHWSDAEIVGWVFRQKDRDGRKVLLRDMSVQSRHPAEPHEALGF